MSFVAPVTIGSVETSQSARHRSIVTALAVALAAFATLAGVGSTAVAQQAGQDPDPFAGVEEMVVVGGGASALLQAEEIAITSFDTSYLQALGVSDLSDISQFTPNLEIRTPFAASNPTLFIRGVGLRDFNANSSSSVAVYNDEIYMNSPAGQLGQLFDVETVDVLKGAQATMYGRNSSAGTIRVIARKPTGEPQASLRATYGRFNQVQLEGAIENRVVPEFVSMRTSFRLNQRDGFVRNRCADPRFNVDPGEDPLVSRRQRIFDQCFNGANTNPDLIPFGGLGWEEGKVPPVKEWVNDQNNWAARTLVRWEQEIGGVGLDVIVNFHGGQNRGDARQFQMIGATQLPTEIRPRADIAADQDGYIDPDNQRIDPNTGGFRSPITNPSQGDPYEGDYNNVQLEKLDLFGTNVVGRFEYADFTLTSITGYEWNQREVEINLDGNPYRSLEPIFTNEAYQVTQELRLDYAPNDALDVQLGGMFLYEGLTVYNQFLLDLFSNGTDQRYTFFTRYGSEWVNVAWEPAESFKVEGGARLNYEDKEINLRSQEFLASTGAPQGSETFASSAARNFGGAGDLKATWTPVEDVNFYLRYAHGWKGPHINGGVVNPNQRASNGASLISPVKPEQVDSIELGMKTQVWDHRVTANWALFYYDYQDLQVFRLQNTGGGVPVQQLINAADADVLGFEFELDAKPFEGWGPSLLDQFWVHASFAWLDSKYTDFVNTYTAPSPNGSGVVTITENLTGNQLINSPKYSFIGFAAWPVGGDWGTLIPRLDWTFKDEVFFDPSNSELLKQDPLWLLNFRLIYKAPLENFEISGWVENLTDQAYTVDVINLARLRRAILHAVGDPRTYGVTATVKF